MSELKYVKGDVTRPTGEGEKPIIIPHVVNDMGRWGSGFVNAITNRWGEGPRRCYLSWANAGKMDVAVAKALEKEFNIHISFETDFELGGLQCIAVPNGITIANMVAQHQVRGMDPTGRPPIRYWALARAMKAVFDEVWINYRNKSRLPEIHCPKFGSDLAQGRWEVIEQMILEIWIDAGVEVTIYEFEK